MKQKLYLFFVLYLVGSLPTSKAQYVPVTTQDFSEITSVIDYTKKTKRSLRLKEYEREPKEEKEAQSFNLDWLNFAGNILNLLSYVLIIFLIGIILYFLFKNLDLSDKSIDYAEEIIFEEEAIEDIDAQSAYMEALLSKDYRTAIRMRFILILQELSSSNSIQWMPEKTNRDYLRELRGQDQFIFFQQTSNIYDRVWYGNTELSKEEFELINPVFELKKSLV